MIPSSSHNLDLLRAAAVLCVFVDHLSAACKSYTLGSLGRFGVILFFVHTSLVLMASLERLDASGLRQKWRLALAFGIRRVFRIYPLSVFCIVLVAVFRIPASPEAAYSWIGNWHFLSNLALTQSLTYSPDILGVLWSLPLEVEMYCLLPFIYFVIRSGRYRSAVVWVLAVIAGLTIPKLSGRLDVFTYAPCFAAGILAFDLAKGVKRAIFPAWLWPCAVAAAIWLYGPADDVSLPHKMLRAWIVTLGLGLVIPLCREIASRWIARSCHYVAKYSYGIYLSHSVVFWLALYRMAGLPLAIRLATLVVGSVGAPVALYHLIEGPLIGVGAQLAGRLRSPAPALD